MPWNENPKMAEQLKIFSHVIPFKNNNLARYF